MPNLGNERDELIISHMSYARQCVRNSGPGRLLDPDDAIAEGYVALIRAVDSFDAQKGASLKTHIRVTIRWHLLNIVINLKIVKRRGPDNRFLIDMPVRVSLDNLIESGWEPEDERVRDRLEIIPEILDFLFSFLLLDIRSREEVLKYFLYGYTLKEISCGIVTRARIGQRNQNSVRNLKNESLTREKKDKAYAARKKKEGPTYSNHQVLISSRTTNANKNGLRLPVP